MPNPPAFQRPTSLHTAPSLIPNADALLAARGADEALRRYAQETTQLMLHWQAGAHLTAAAALHEAVAQALITPAEVAALAGAEAARLCRLYRARIGAPPPPDWRGSLAVLQRVRIYAAAYADPALALLSVAHLWHAALFGPAQGAPAAAAQAHAPHAELQSILLPILEMLGLRELRDQVDAYPGAPRAASADLPSADDHRLFFDYLNELLPPSLLEDVQLIPRENPFAWSDHLAPATERGAVQQQAYYAELLAPSTAACYRLLERLHARPLRMRPIEGSVIDTVASCRPNGHRSLQTSLVVPLRRVGMRLTLQIVTPTMRQVNRWGAAAFYFDGQRDLLAAAAHQEALAAAPAPMADLDQLYADAWWNARRAASTLIDAALPGSLSLAFGAERSDAPAPPATRTVVFSPLGEPFDLVPGSTVVDYAYSVHSELAEQCRRFYINGEAVEPATVLRHMDLVELEHDPRAPGPTEAWLNAARTKKARTRIRRYLRRQSQSINEGQQIVDARLRALEEHYGFHVPDHRVDEAMARAARRLNLPSTEELLAEVAAGRVHADRYLHGIFAEEIVRRLDLPRALRVRPDRIVLAQCCRPRPGDDVVGLPYAHKGVLSRVTIHKATCPRYLTLDTAASAEAMPLRWRLRAQRKIAVHLDISARDDHGLLGDALQVIYSSAPRVTLFRTDAAARRGVARLRFSLEADCQETVDELTDQLRRLAGREVSAVRQLALSPSEQEALHADATGAANPYSRRPVHDPTMFFGRTHELELISQAVDHNIDSIQLRGHKRVGKTSLLLHLRNHTWEPHVAVCAFVDLQEVSDLAHANIFFAIADHVYEDLNRDPRIAALGAPVRSSFTDHAPRRLAEYLNAVRARLGTRHLIVLIDEFSRTTDLLLAGELARDFFDQWRSLLQFCTATTFIMVIQQKTYDRSLQQEPETTRNQLTTPYWQTFESVTDVHLRPLGADDARRLIEWPIHNFVDYAPGGAERVLQLTGGSPFLIHAFCNRLVSRMAQEGAHTVTLADIEEVAELFMQPTDSLFAHLLDLAPDRADELLSHMAQRAEQEAGASADARISWAQIRIRDDEAPDSVRAVLATLCANDILAEVAPDVWRFTSTLFRRWLARNPAGGAW